MGILDIGPLPNNTVNTEPEAFFQEAKTELLNNILDDAKPYLNQRQITELNKILIKNLKEVDVLEKERFDIEDIEKENERLLNLFVENKRLAGLSERSLDYYLGTINSLLNYTNKAIPQINADDIRGWLMNYKKTRDISNTSLNNMRRNLSSFFGWLENENLIMRSPLRQVQKIKDVYNVRQPFNKEDLAKLRDACDNYRDRALLEFFISTGCRVGEVNGVDIDEVDWNNKTIIVTGKGSKQREVFFSSACKFYLKKYLKNRTDDNPALFVTLKKPYSRLQVNGMEVVIRKLGKRSGVLNCHPHRFRHTFATTLLDQGVSIDHIKEFLGHVKVETTLKYAHINKRQLMETHRKFMD